MGNKNSMQYVQSQDHDTTLFWSINIDKAQYRKRDGQNKSIN